MLQIYGMGVWGGVPKLQSRKPQTGEVWAQISVLSISRQHPPPPPSPITLNLDTLGLGLGFRVSGLGFRV